MSSSPLNPYPESLVRKDRAAGEDGQVMEDAFEVVSKARCFDGSDLQLTAKLVEDAGSPRLAVDVLWEVYQ